MESILKIMASVVWSHYECAKIKLDKLERPFWEYPPQ